MPCIAGAGSFVDHIPVAERYFVAPSFTWDISDATQLTLLTQFIEEDTGVAQPLPAEGTVLANPNGRIPRSRGIGEPALRQHGGHQPPAVRLGILASIQ